MSQYENYIKDFPMRCKELYEELHPTALILKKEVTFMLMVASASILIPFERLRPTNVLDPIHPSKDPIIFKKHADNLKKLLDTNINKSLLWPLDLKYWMYGDSAEMIFDPNYIGDNQLTEMSPNHKVANIFFIIRNALAHSNIYTFEDPIKYIFFVSWKKKNNIAIGTKFIRVTTDEFRIFINKWLKFLIDTEIDSFTLWEVLKQESPEELAI